MNRNLAQMGYGRLARECAKLDPKFEQMLAEEALSRTLPERAEARSDPMKKAEGEMRSEYKRSDFARLERGQFHAEVAKGAPVVVLSPSNANAFPSSQAVNDALSGLLELTQRTSRARHRSTRTRVKTVRAG